MQISGELAARTSKCKQVLPIFHWDAATKWQAKNFGDDMNVDIVAWVLNMPAKEIASTVRAQDHKLVAIGSVLHFAQSGDVVWGTGIHEKGLRQVNWKNLKEADIYALRGPRSKAQALRRAVNVTDMTVFGDPGLLSPLVWPDIFATALAENNGKPTYDRCFVPHHSDEPAFVESGPRHNIVEELHLHIITTADTPNATASALIKCKHVISTSLHGLIVAHAFGVPATWLHDDLGKSAKEGFLKYNDYLASVGLEPYHYAGSLYEAATGRFAQLPEVNVLQSVWHSLLRAFPYERVCSNGPEMRSELMKVLQLSI